MVDKEFDILIPIHNALDEVIACVDSVLKYSEGENYRLFLLDDNSDQPTKDYLDSMSHPSVEVVHLEKQGYLKTINYGLLKYRTKYKVCLNSDIVVTPLWLAKLRSCVESRPSIGLVSPLTNNGIGLSVKLPEGFNYIEISEIINARSLRLYPDACTVLGFCMLIKQEVIDLIGGFDSYFDPGYYEECDYQYQAFEKGFASAICDDLYVYHKGQASFKTQKAQLLAANRGKFHERWDKYYLPQYREYDRIDALGHLREKRGRHLKNQSPIGKYDIVFVVKTEEGDNYANLIALVNSLIRDGGKIGIVSFWLQRANLDCYVAPIMYSSQEDFIADKRFSSYVYVSTSDLVKKSVNQKALEEGVKTAHIPELRNSQGIVIKEFFKLFSDRSE